MSRAFFRCSSSCQLLDLVACVLATTNDESVRINYWSARNVARTRTFSWLNCWSDFCWSHLNRCSCFGWHCVVHWSSVSTTSVAASIAGVATVVASAGSAAGTSPSWFSLCCSGSCYYYYWSIIFI